MNFSLAITEILWIFPLLILGAILLALLGRKLFTSFPLFFAYAAAVFLRECVLLFLSYPSKVYARVYWYGEIATIVFGLGAILETLRHLCAPYSLRKVVSRLMWIVVGFSSQVPILMLISATNGRAIETVMLAERSARFVQSCSLILVIFLVSQLGSSWLDYSVGIAAGFGIYSALSLAIFELGARLHLIDVPAIVMLNSAAYNVAAIIWGIYFLRPQLTWRSERLPTANLSEWNEAVSAYYTQKWRRQH